MTDNLSNIQDKPLTSIAIPGSHDAGMYKSRRCSYGGVGPSECNTKTQSLSLKEQLKCGVRYFDLRPVSSTKDGSLTFDIGHFGNTHNKDLGIVGCLGASLETALDDIWKFAKKHPNEVIVLLFSHYFDRDNQKFAFDRDTMNQFISEVGETLGPYLVKSSTALNLVSEEIGTVLQAGSVIALFDSVDSDWPNGILNASELPIYNNYSDTNEFSEMEKDQFHKWDRHGGSTTELFLLSWTLTQSNKEAEFCSIDPTHKTLSIKDLAEIANRKFDDVKKHKDKNGIVPNIFHTDYVDGNSTGVVLDLNGLPAASEIPNNSDHKKAR